MRAWDKSNSKIAFVYRDKDSGRKKIGEVKFDWWFYVKTSDYEHYKNQFNSFIEQNLIIKCEPDGLYTKIYVERSHKSELLNTEMEFVWEHKNFQFNQLSEKLALIGIQTYEADVLPYKRFCLQDDVEFEKDYKLLFLDIETDDRIRNGQPIPGEYRILSVALGEYSGKIAWLCIEEDTDEAEKAMLIKMAKVLNAYDVIIGWNSSLFDLPYIKSRFMRYGISIDWRKLFHQDFMKIFQKSVSLRSYSLDAVAKEMEIEGKIEHDEYSIYRMWKENRELLKKYNIQDVNIMIELEKKKSYLSTARNVNAIGMCPCDDPFITRKIDNLMLKQAQEDKHFHFKTMIKNYGEEEIEEENSYEGAYVFPTKPGIYDNIKVLDFASLYPNTIKTFNISPDTLIAPSDKIDDSFVITTPTTSKHKFRKDFIGILPKVIMKMKENRDYYKRLMSKEIPGSLMHKTYNELQYVYKSFGLSFYGALGEKHTRFYDVRIAESVTLAGQYFIKTCAAWLEKQGKVIIYGDTDSTFVQHVKDTEVNKIITCLAKLCDLHAKQKFNCDECTLEMDYDKGFHKFIICNAKKKYAGYLDFIDGHIVNPYKLKIAGFEYIRNDVCQFVKKYQKEFLTWILEDNKPDLMTVREWILDKQRQVMSGNLLLEDLVFSKKITKPLSEYATDLPQIKVAKDMILDGKDFWVGDKVQYFFLTFDSKKKPVPLPIYKFNNKYNESYYWNNCIYPAFERILVVAYPTIKWDEYYISDKNKTGSLKVGRSLWS